jgi:YVTN family beta-propeller protein
VGLNPYQLAAAGSILYVANEGSNTVSVVDTAVNTVQATISSGVGVQPYGIAYVSASREMYVANILSNNVSVIDANPSSPAYNTVTHNIPTGVHPFYVATIGSNVYVTNNMSNTVSVIDTVSHTVIATISVGNQPLGIKPSGTNLYVANSNAGASGYGAAGAGGTISVIDTTSNTVTATILVGAGPRGVAVSGTQVYVANFADNTVSVIDSATNSVVHTIPVGKGPRGLLTLGSVVYVENFHDGTISVINTGSNTVTATVPVGNAPAGMAALGSNVYVSRFTDSSLSILNTLTNTLDALPFDVSDNVKVTSTALVYDRTAATYNGTITIKNTSSSTLAAPIQFVFTNLTSGARLVNQTGNVAVGPYARAPYITVSPNSSLKPGGSISFTVTFSYSGSGSISYTPKTLSGNF